MKNPFLVAESIYLRGLISSDIKVDGPYFQWFNDQEVSKGNSHGRFPNTEDSMNRFFAHLSDQRDLVLAMIEKKSERHIGNLSLQKIQWVDRTAEFAIVLGEKDCWGKGYASQAAELILRHGFESLNLNRIYCGTTENNTAMQKLAKNLGMREEGRRRAAVFKDGRYHDVLEFGILREEFLKKR